MVQKLTDPMRIFIVQRLAMYDMPKKIMADFKEEFGQEIGSIIIRNYDVGGGRRKIAKNLVAIYTETRKKFLKEAGEIPIAQRSFRLRRLNAIHEHLLEKGNVMAAAQILEQAAKEAGDVFTNVTKVKGKVELPDDNEFKAGETRATLAELIERALKQTAPKGETKH